MRPSLVALIIVSILLSAGSQILLKLGMTSPAVKNQMTGQTDTLQLVFTIASSPSVLLGLACFGLSAIVWLFVLAKIPLSSAYPFVALGIAITVLAGKYFFNEPISALKIAGVALILAGIGAVASSS